MKERNNQEKQTKSQETDQKKRQKKEKKKAQFKKCCVASAPETARLCSSALGELFWRLDAARVGPCRKWALLL